MLTAINADQFLERLQAQASPTEAANYQRHFQTQVGGYGEGDRFLGVSMGEVFALTKVIGNLRFSLHPQWSTVSEAVTKTETK